LFQESGLVTVILNTAVLLSLKDTVPSGVAIWIAGKSVFGCLGQGIGLALENGMVGRISNESTTTIQANIKFRMFTYWLLVAVALRSFTLLD
jgi:hypothetical protein